MSRPILRHLCSTALLLAAPAALAAGAIDPSFGTAGNGVLTNFSTDVYGNKSAEEGLALLLRDDGEVMVVGGSDRANGDVLRIALYQADGTLDTGYCGGGRNSIATGIYGFNTAAVRPDGKILVAGSDLSSGDSQFVLQRYLADGTRDASFNAVGQVATNLTGFTDQFLAVAVQGDGKILALGSSVNGSTSANVVVYRFNDDGTPDTGFGSGGGHISLSAGTGAGEVLTPGAIGIQSDGKIVIAGGLHSSSDAFFLLRLTSAGTADSSFSANGFKTYAISASGQTLRFFVSALAIESSDRITVGGYVLHTVTSTSAQSTVPALFRTDAGGVLDSATFGGIREYAANPPKHRTHAFLKSLTVLADGSVIAMGRQEDSLSSTVPTNFQPLLFRAGSDGNLDSSFVDGTAGFDGSTQPGGWWNGLLTVAGANALFATGGGVTAYSLGYSDYANLDFLSVRLDLGSLSTTGAVGGAGSRGAGATVLHCSSGGPIAGGGYGSGALPLLNPLLLAALLRLRRRARR